jgi:hypothetical protein
VVNQTIIDQRLANQHIQAVKPFSQPGELVTWFGAVQAQDYPASKWAIGLRLPGCSAADIEEAITRRSIVRTWALRGTLHIIAARDIRWILALVRPSVVPRHAPYDRRLGLDEKTFEHSRALLEKTLQGGKQLTRKELATLFEQNQISTQGLRMAFLLYRAALDGIICFGPLRGKQPTFTLLEEWMPPSPTKDREEALAELCRRFFSSHGPATVKDFAWWSGLAAADVKTAFGAVRGQLFSEQDGEQTFWWSQDLRQPIENEPAPDVQLVPDFDEYLVGYSDRQSFMHPKIEKKVDTSFGLLGPTILINGWIGGAWKRTFDKQSVVIVCQPFYALNPIEIEKVTAAANRFASFLGMPAIVKIDA